MIWENPLWLYCSVSIIFMLFTSTGAGMPFFSVAALLLAISNQYSTLGKSLLRLSLNIVLPDTFYSLKILVKV